MQLREEKVGDATKQRFWTSGIYERVLPPYSFGNFMVLQFNMPHKIP